MSKLGGTTPENYSQALADARSMSTPQIYAALAYSVLFRWQVRAFEQVLEERRAAARKAADDPSS